MVNARGVLPTNRLLRGGGVSKQWCRRDILSCLPTRFERAAGAGTWLISVDDWDGNGPTMV